MEELITKDEKLKGVNVEENKTKRELTKNMYNNGKDMNKEKDIAGTRTIEKYTKKYKIPTLLKLEKAQCQ